LIVYLHLMFGWIGAVLGYLITKSFYGGLAGYFLGSMFQPKTRMQNDPMSYFGNTQTRYDFPTMMMALTAVVMKSDGKIIRAELDYVKQFFRQQFGNGFTSEHLKILKAFLERPEIPTAQICEMIRTNTSYEVRKVLVHYLYGLGFSDGQLESAERQSIESIARMLGVSDADREQLFYMYGGDPMAHYKILGISAEATDDEIKRAYRKLAVLHHPDKVASEPEAVQKSAKEQFQKIQQAYEQIKKNRGFK